MKWCVCVCDSGSRDLEVVGIKIWIIHAAVTVGFNNSIWLDDNVSQATTFPLAGVIENLVY